MRRRIMTLIMRKHHESEPRVNYVKELARALLNHNGERRAVGRRLVFDLVGPFTPTVAVDHEGLRYFVNTTDKVVSRRTFGGGGFDEATMEQAVRLLEQVFGRSCFRDATFIDIGANIGTTTMPALKTFGAARAHAFEPAPENYRLLECNLMVNGLSARAVAWPIALSDAPGTAVLELSETNSGDHRIRTVNTSPGAFDERSRGTIEVPVSTLDLCLDEAGVDRRDIGLVWIDAQGHEGHVLAGSRSVVQAGIPIVCEYWPYGLRRAGGLSMFHQLVAEGYSSIIDVRRSVAGGVTRYAADSVQRLETIYSGPRDFTDLILVK